MLGREVKPKSKYFEVFLKNLRKVSLHMYPFFLEMFSCLPMVMQGKTAPGHDKINADIFKDVEPVFIDPVCFLHFPQKLELYHLILRFQKLFPSIKRVIKSCSATIFLFQVCHVFLKYQRN